MTYIASYYSKAEGLFKKTFNTLSEVEAYNKLHNIKNHNLHQEVFLSEIVQDGLIVCVEGDYDLDDKELSNYLKTLPNFVMLNNIYNEPEKLLQLKDKKVDILVIASTGVYKDKINALEDWYISQKLPYPNTILDCLSDADEILKKLLSASPNPIDVYKLIEIGETDIICSMWLGV